VTARFIKIEALKAVVLLAVNAIIVLVLREGIEGMTLSLVMIPMWIALDWIAYRRDNPWRPKAEILR
jgi:hypothetical protein